MRFQVKIKAQAVKEFTNRCSQINAKRKKCEEKGSFPLSI